MCGITGWVDYRGGLLAQTDVLDRMVATLANRGPDSAGAWVADVVALGHRRLAVVDPAGGAQPMVRQEGDRTCVISYNGELYNSDELRAELAARGRTFSSHCDTEVLLLAYMEWGISCPQKLNGIFAFAIWDSEAQTLFMCRDRMGVKPLFYTEQAHRFLFGSEIKALLAHPSVRPEVDIEGLAEVLLLGPSRTPGHGVFRGVSELRPAHCLLLSHAGTRVWRYWSLESAPHPDDLDTTSDYLHWLLRDTCRRQLVADVPVCSLLSGGLDSSAITAFAVEGLAEQGVRPMRTFSVDYVDNDRNFQQNDFQPDPDAPWVKVMAAFLGTDHTNVVLDTPEVVEALTTAVRARDLPGMVDVDSSLYLFCAEVKKQATVALSGESADEVFGGYPWFHRADLLGCGTFPWNRRTNARLGILSPGLREKLGPLRYVEGRYSDTMAEVPALAGEDPIEARRRSMFYLNLTWFLTTLLDRKDRMSMATGLEVRVPFCDHRIVEYAWNIPWSIKMHRGREKGILRRAVAGDLPTDVVWRKKSPYPKTWNPAYFLRMERELRDILANPTSPLLQLIDPVALAEVMDSSGGEFEQPWFGQLMARPHLYAYLYSVNWWLREYGVSVV